MPRAMVVIAHPDDETIALGARLARFGGAHFVHVTDGAPRDEQDSRAHGFATLSDYRAARAQELESLFQTAGIPNVRRECFGIPDQEAALHLASLSRRITQLLDRFSPEIVFTHPYEGGHPDHDACAFAVRHAVQLQLTRGHSAPVVAEAPFYHAGPYGIETAVFLGDSPAGLEYCLSEAERQPKELRLRCFVTQQQTLQPFPLGVERFRLAPAYDFTRAPHPGRVWYENFSWGMTSSRFCELARDAQRALQIQEEPATC